MKNRMQFICFQRACPAGATGDMRYNTIILAIFMSVMLADGISRAAFSANLPGLLLTINDMPSLSSVLGGSRRIRRSFHFYFLPQGRRTQDSKKERLWSATLLRPAPWHTVHSHSPCSTGILHTPTDAHHLIILGI